MREHSYRYATSSDVANSVVMKQVIVRGFSEVACIPVSKELVLPEHYLIQKRTSLLMLESIGFHQLTA